MAEDNSDIRAYGGDGPYVFVSYAHADRKAVLKEIRWLADAGYNVWFDEGIAPAHDWPEALAGAIESASLFLLFVTPRSMSSNNCARETTFAVSHGIPVLAIYLENTSLPAGLELSIGNSQAIFRHELSDPVYREKLQAALGTHVQAEAPAPTETTTPAGRSSRLVMAAIIAVLTVAGLAWFLANPSDHTAEDLAALQQQINELDTTVGSSQGNTLTVFLAARELGETVPTDTWERIAVTGQPLTEPPGAAISLRNTDADATWIDVGIADGSPQRFPRGQYVYRFAQDGYQSREMYGDALVLFTRVFRPPTDDLTVPLSPMNAAPMIEIPDSTTTPAATNYVTQPFVPVPGFKVSKYEVTNEQYKAFVDAGGYEDPRFWQDLPAELPFEMVAGTFTDSTGRPGPAGWEVGTYPLGKASHPVAGVSWYEAMAYAAFRDASLPTVYHWAQSALPYYASVLAPLSNMNSTASEPVDRMSIPGAMGNFNAYGNVREWAVNAWGDRRWIMGGGWSDPEYLAALPFSLPPMDRSELNGIRLYHFDAPYPEELAAPMDASFTDYRDEAPVSDEAFAVIADQYVDAGDALQAEVVAIEQADSWIRETVRLNANLPGETFLVHIFKPKSGSRPFQVITYAPPISDFWGAGDSNTIDLTRRFLNLDLIPRSGRALVWPVYYGSFERYFGLFNMNPARRDQLQTDMRINWVADMKRTLDYLETRDEFDVSKLGYLGYSYGASHFTPMLAMENRFKAAVLIGGGLAKVGFNSMPVAAEPMNFLPRIRVPVLMINGENDFVFPVETSQEPMFRHLGTPAEHKRHLIMPGDHYQISAEAMTRDMTQWFDRYLGQP